MIRMVTDSDELERLLMPIFKRNGAEIPKKGAYVAAIQFDDAGEVVGYQMAQSAVFLEGMWGRDHSVQLRALYNTVTEYLASRGACGAMTFTRNDRPGQRIGKLAKRLGFEAMNWTVWRKC